MSMAISISEPPNMKPIVPFAEKMPDKRWNKKSATKFLKLLNQFYEDANCEAFFKSHSEIYEIASDRFNKVYENIDLQWYQTFYGQKPKGEFRIVNALGNGGGNYGPKLILPSGEEIVYSIMGTWSVDSSGLPKYEVDAYFPTLLHEFNHSFINHIVEKYHPQLKESGETIFAELNSVMRNQAYSSWETMYAEALVRASVIKYLIDHRVDDELIEKEINKQLNRGFLWTDKLVEELERYDDNREEYKSLERFMPEVVKFFNKIASQKEQLKSEIEKRRPNVIAIAPFENNKQDVYFSTDQISIEFDKPLNGRGYSINYGKKGKKAFPEFGKIKYSEDKKTVFMEVKLKPNKEYQFILTGYGFVSKDGFGIKDYEINFKTKQE